MPNEQAKKTRKFSIPETIWIIILSVVAAGAIFLIALGIIGDHLPVKNSDNWIASLQSSFQNTVHLSYRWFGTIVLIVDALIAAIVLNYFAKKSDKNEERALRRAQRLQIISASGGASDDQVSAATAKEVEAKPVEEPAKKESPAEEKPAEEKPE
ncbi:MAG: hypothetical protein K5694_00095 [Bacilli bacterium]|nr:hypothetical protein [Bacilli bacterium]